MVKDAVIIALSRSEKLGEKVALALGIETVARDVNRFSDGEILVEIHKSVRGKNVYIIQSTSAPTNESIMELLITIDAVKRASAASINVVIPYYGYARQDRKAKPRQPITSRLVADMLQTAGANRVITYDLHAAQIQGFFTIPIDDIKALPLLARYFTQMNLENIVVVSPDHGGTTRARRLAEILDAPIAIIDKRRPKPNVSEVMNIIGNVEGKTAIIIDDMIDTAGTIVAGAEAIKKMGATEVFVCCTHPVFSGPALERLENSCIKEVVVTDTIELDEENLPEKIKVITISNTLARIIDHIENIKPVSDAVDFFSKY